MRSGFWFVAALALAGLWACSPSGGRPPTSTTSEASAEPWVYVSEDLWVPVVDPLGQSLDRASRAFDAQQLKGAAGSLRDGAAFLRAQAGGLPAADVEALTGAAGKLEDLAQELEKGVAVPRPGFASVLMAAFDADADHRWGTVSAAEWVPAVERINERFQQALERLGAHDVPGALANVRKSAALVRLEAGRASEAERQALEGAWFALRQLGAKLEVAPAANPPKLEPVFARVSQALAGSHQAEAARRWAEHRPDQAGAALVQAAEELRRGRAWAHAEAEPETTAAIEACHGLATRLTGGARVDAKEVDTTLAALHLEIEKLAQLLSPAPAH